AFTSEATTAKPRPASPARAASMVALSASRLVWPAMVLISSTTSPIRVAAFDSSLTRSVVPRAWPTASLAIRADSCTWRLISLTEDDSSSVADATDCTFVEASSEAAATVVASSCERSAVEVRVPAETSSSLEARQNHAEIAAGKFLHPGGETEQRPDDAARDQEGDGEAKQHGKTGDHLLRRDGGIDPVCRLGRRLLEGRVDCNGDLVHLPDG